MNFQGLNVGQFMDRLKAMPADEPVKFDFVHFGPTKLESYRGFYEDAALGYEECGHLRAGGVYGYPKAGELLAHFERTMGKVFCGWKGGNGRPIIRDTSLWVANPGETGGTVIVDVQYLESYVTIVTRHEDERYEPSSSPLLASPVGPLDDVDVAASEVAAELRRAMALFGPFKNGHEGWAVIREEVDELWDEVKNNKGDDHVARQRKEAIQVAAMALRFVVDLGSQVSTR